jgi:Ca2+-binding RTX toxin-like protein
MGGTGSDSINATLGTHMIYGNQGNDTISLNSGSYTTFGGQGDDTIHADDSSNVIYGNQGADSIATISGSSTVFGGQNDDHYNGSFGSAVVYGNKGDDSLSVENMAATVFGGQGDDDIVVGGHVAGTGSSLAKLTGGTGVDTMQLNFTGNAASGMSETGFTEITDLTTQDTLAFHDNSAAFTTETQVQNHVTMADSGANLELTFHNSVPTLNGTMQLDGLGGKGLTNFAAMDAAGFHLSFS